MRSILNRSRFWSPCMVIGALGAALVILVLVLATPALATTANVPYRVIKVAAARLATRPALILPGQWQDPAGPVLVRECFASYPYRGHAAELLSCLTAPDPRLTDRRVMTIHQYHVLHLRHVAHTHH